MNFCLSKEEQYFFITNKPILFAIEYTENYGKKKPNIDNNRF